MLLIVFARFCSCSFRLILFVLSLVILRFAFCIAVFTHRAKQRTNLFLKKRSQVKKVLCLCSQKVDVALENLAPHLDQLFHTREWVTWSLDKNTRVPSDYPLNLLEPEALHHFPTALFDAVVLFSCPCCTTAVMNEARHVPQEVTRILRPGGHLLIKCFDYFPDVGNWTVLDHCFVPKGELQVSVPNFFFPLRHWRQPCGLMPFHVFTKI